MRVIFIFSILKISNFPCICRRKAKYYNGGQFSVKNPGKPLQIENYLPKPTEMNSRSASVQLLKRKAYGLFLLPRPTRVSSVAKKETSFVYPLQSSLHFPCSPYSCIFISSGNIVFYPIILSGYSSITSCAFPRRLYSPCTQFFSLAFMFCHKLLVLLPQSRVS